MIRGGEYPDIMIPSPKNKCNIKVQPQTTFSIGDNCLVLGDAGFRERGKILGASFLFIVFLFVPYLIISYFLIKDQAYWMVIGFLATIVIVSHPFFIGAWYEITRKSVYPVIFNRKNGKVYFFNAKDVELKCMHWKDCTYAVSDKGRSISARKYELRGFLMDGHRVEDSFSFGDTVLEMKEAPKNEVFYLFYYIQAFMEYDDQFEQPPKLMSWRPSLSESARHTIPRLITDNSTVNFLSTVFYRTMCVFFSWQILGHYLICRYGKIPQWSQEIIDECGEDIVLK